MSTPAKSERKRTMKKALAISLIIALLLSLTACGGLHNSRHIVAKNLITDKSIVIDLDVTDYADTGNFSNFTVDLSYNELMGELFFRSNISDVTGVGFPYAKLYTDSGEFYIKCNTEGEADSYTYSLFADVGKVESGSQYVYIPFHLFSHYENYDYPAHATPFEGDVTYDSERYTMEDFADYYESKEIYTVEKPADTILKITDNKTNYRFVLELFPQQNIVYLHNADVEE